MFRIMFYRLSKSTNRTTGALHEDMFKFNSSPSPCTITNVINKFIVISLRLKVRTISNEKEGSTHDKLFSSPCQHPTLVGNWVFNIDHNNEKVRSLRVVLKAVPAVKHSMIRLGTTGLINVRIDSIEI